MMILLLGMLDVLSAISMLFPGFWTTPLLTLLFLKGLWSLSVSRDIFFITLSLLDMLSVIFFMLHITLLIRALALYLALKGIWSLL